MRTTSRLATTVSALLLLTAPLAAQPAPDGSKGSPVSGGTATPTASAPVEKTDEEKAAEEAKKSWVEGRP